MPGSRVRVHEGAEAHDIPVRGKHVRERIFDLFTQVDSAIDRTDGGFLTGYRASADEWLRRGPALARHATPAALASHWFDRPRSRGGSQPCPRCRVRRLFDQARGYRRATEFARTGHAEIHEVTSVRSVALGSVASVAPIARHARAA